MRKLVAGNWKMNGTSADLPQLNTLADQHGDASVDVVICGPATLLSRMADTGLSIGGEDCHPSSSGAYTGDISATMIADTGATYVITGHSERRTDHNEDDALIASKATAGWDAGLHVIICIGESEAQYRAGKTLDILRAQMDQSIPDEATAKTTTIAYEPIWAIGTGLTPTADEIGAVHAALRTHLETRFGAEGSAMRLLYGGSVKASNADEIFALANVDGALVGGASLKATDFSPIITALEKA
ncbi:triose-phosphate isomerase [Octadecabacter sp. 1_MG-2023]|uniref:triose-phosphate isomerase n=1 Tax=unclassified Octadecabacter TaxID=196158 RepID=UPI001C0A06E3|nr:MULTISPECIES: triose-phosphate isomerase [unclassified Octadecabacter]MBU2993530.1 triose-phosphate isomerase [Octadecabacter sp. B2R22]MDO6735626.1 triose-phosphate isomerase [Octadecabacter sp. 1_MG-2023]